MLTLDRMVEEVATFVQEHSQVVVCHPSREQEVTAIIQRMHVEGLLTVRPSHWVPEDTILMMKEGEFTPPPLLRLVD